MPIKPGLIAPYTIRSAELPGALQIASSTLHLFLKRAGFEFSSSDQQPRRRGAPIDVSPSDVRKILELRGYQFPKRAKVISFLMCKGGVGKTTSSFFVGQRMSAYGAKVLLIDSDAQGNLTSAFFLERQDYPIDEETPILLDILTKEVKIEDAIISLTSNLHLIPSTLLNVNLDDKIRETYAENVGAPIKDSLAPILEQYDYVIIDCAPAINLTNAAIVSASDLVIVPVSPHRFCEVGMNQTLTEITRIETDLGAKVEKKLVLTKYTDKQLASLVTYLPSLGGTYKDSLFASSIRDCEDVLDSITKNQNLFSLKKSVGREDYDNLTQEIMGFNTAFGKRPSKILAD